MVSYRWLCLFVTTACVSLAPPAQAEGAYLDLLYIDANEGRASGGHAALRLNQEVFHFQHVEPGLLRITRDDFSNFRLAYGFQENRSIHGHRIAISDTQFQDLRETLNRRLLIQNQQFDQLTTLLEDRQLLTQLTRPSSAIALKGLGYFAGSTTSQGPSPALTELRQALIEREGPDTFQRRQEQLSKQLVSLRPIVDNAMAAISTNHLPLPISSFSQRYRAMLTNRAALSILASASAPQADRMVSSDLPEFRLSEADKRALQGFRQTLFDDALALLNSERRDWGYPLLIAMARLHAIDLSLNRGHWTLIERASTSSDEAILIDTANQHEVLTYTRTKFAKTLSALTASARWDEKQFNDLERMAASLLDIENAIHSAKAVAISRIDTSPSLAANSVMEPLNLSQTELQNALKAVDKRLANYQQALQSAYAYHLLDRNCVTEIFDVLNQTLPNVGLETTPFDAIPFVAFDDWQMQHTGIDYRLPTYRELAIERMLENQNAWRVAITESNIVTSSIYRWHDKDAAFLFFTQDAILPRPLMGATNLAVAAGQSLWGLLSLPWNQGETLRQGMKGMAMSLPELLFFNIRKGSFPNVVPWLIDD